MLAEKLRLEAKMKGLSFEECLLDLLTLNHDPGERATEYNAWAQANMMHTCFYEGWCRRDDVEVAFVEVEKLVKEVERRIKTGAKP